MRNLRRDVLEEFAAFQPGIDWNHGERELFIGPFQRRIHVVTLRAYHEWRQSLREPSRQVSTTARVRPRGYRLKQLEYMREYVQRPDAKEKHRQRQREYKARKNAQQVNA